MLAPGESDSTTTTKGPLIVRIGTSGLAVDYGPLYVAKQKHWLDEVLKPYGATYEYEVFESISAIIEAHASERIDCMFEAEARAIVVAAAGISGKILSIFRAALLKKYSYRKTLVFQQ